MSYRTTRILAVAASLAAIPILAHAEPTFLEGHVFNKRTGVPLRNAFVVIQTEIPLPVADCNGCSRFLGDLTDSNGFYSFEFSETEVDLLAADRSIGITASCVVSPEDSRTVGFSSPLVLRPGTLRRDLYIDASRRRFFTRCLGFIRQPPE